MDAMSEADAPYLGTPVNRRSPTTWAMMMKGMISPAALEAGIIQVFDNLDDIAPWLKIELIFNYQDEMD